MNRLIDADVLIEKAHQESKGMSYPYREDFGLLVEWIVDKTPVVQTCEDAVSRQAAIDAADKIIERDTSGSNAVVNAMIAWSEYIRTLPSAQPSVSDCWGCNCPKMERVKEQKTFSEMVHLHDDETHDKRTETHACDLISRVDVEQTVEDNILCYTHSDRPIDQDPDTECHMAIRTAFRMLRKDLRKLPSVQPDPGEWNNHTVACLLAALFGDACACNFNGIDEWLPEKCEVIDACPNPVGVACWEQFLKHRAERRTECNGRD